MTRPDAKTAATHEMHTESATVQLHSILIDFKQKLK